MTGPDDARRGVDVARRPRARARRRRVVGAPLATPPRPLHLHPTLTPYVTPAETRATAPGPARERQPPRLGWPSPARSSATNASRSASKSRTSVLHLVGEAVDGDEQRELAVAERVEDLAVVAARPHRVAVGHQAQPGDVVAGAQQLGHRAADPGHRQPRVEQRRDHAQRDEVAERVRPRADRRRRGRRARCGARRRAGRGCTRRAGRPGSRCSPRTCRRSGRRVVAAEALAPATARRCRACS